MTDTIKHSRVAGEICSMTPGENVGHWNVFRWGMVGDARNVALVDLPTDAHDWLTANRKET